ncbi:Predicted arabinose efflux permease, MFS family [Salinicoccus halodurans]|nr:MFS transporter [Salinicoccus halodurans]SFK81573.1 Predicted arabinose efflux permease, MFS family [Salinicoccus halodurans]
MMKNDLKKKRFWKLALILFLTEMVRGMFILSYLPALPTIGLISIGLSSIVITMHYVLDSVTNVWLGFLIRKIGEVWTMLLSYFIGIGAMVAVGFDQSFWTLLAAACLLGISVCPIWIMALSNVEEKSRGRDMGLVFFSWLTGLGAGMVTMNFLIGIFAEEAVFSMAGVFVVNLLVFLVLPGNRKEVVEAVADDTVGAKVGNDVYSVDPEDSGSSSKRRDRSGRKKRLPLRDTWFILKHHAKNMPGIMLQGLGVGMLLPVLPTYITSELSLNYFQYTFFILIVFGLVGFSMTVLSRALDTNSVRLTFAVICGGFLIYAVGIMWFSTLETIWLIFAIASFIGLSYGIMLPAWNKYLAGTIMQDKSAESWGVISSVQGIGAMIGPALGGLTADLFGTVDATLLASGLIFVLLFVYYAVLFGLRWRSAAE